MGRGSNGELLRYDTRLDGAFAGTIALLNCDEKMAVGEIGHVSLLQDPFPVP